VKVELLRALFLEQLRDLYEAELRLITALATIIKTSSSDDLQAAFAEHLKNTQGHANRIEFILDQLGEEVPGKKKKRKSKTDGKALLKAGDTVHWGDEYDPQQAVTDVGPGGGRSAEHYELTTVLAAVVVEKAEALRLSPGRRKNGKRQLNQKS
jgi:ferritin-like metal-binding protein YciE